MKTGAEIVRVIRAAENGNLRLHLFDEHRLVIEAALLAYKPSVLRTILDRTEHLQHITLDELAEARAELDRLEQKNSTP